MLDLTRDDWFTVLCWATPIIVIGMGLATVFIGTRPDRYRSVSVLAEPQKQPRHHRNERGDSTRMLGCALLVTLLVVALAVGCAVKAHATTADTTDHKVSLAETRATTAGESRAHILNRIGPVTEEFNRNGPLFRVRDYLTYHRSNIWRVAYDVDRKMNVVHWRFLHCEGMECRVIAQYPKQQRSDMGDTINQDPHGVLTSTDMPTCASNQGRPCINYNPPTTGNDAHFQAASQQAKWVGTDGADHFFWKTDPVLADDANRNWLDDYGDALINGLKASYPSVNKNWHRAFFNLNPGGASYAQFPDGSAYLM